MSNIQNGNPAYALKSPVRADVMPLEAILLPESEKSSKFRIPES